MAVNITEIGTVYNVLEGLVIGALDEQYEAGRIKGAEYATVLESVTSTLMQLALKAVQQQPKIDADVLSLKVNSFALLADTNTEVELAQAKILLTREEIDTAGLQEAATKQKTTDIALASAADVALKEAQKLYILAQQDEENAKADLLDKQALYYPKMTRLQMTEQGATLWAMYLAGEVSATAYEDLLLMIKTSVDSLAHINYTPIP